MSSGYFQTIENLPYLSNNVFATFHNRIFIMPLPHSSLFSIVYLFAFLCLHSAVAKDKDKQSFKLRAGMDKKIVIYVQQTSNKELAIER